MTLRDDVIFFLFLIQVYLYKVDKTRTNEFGYAYDEDDQGHGIKGETEAVTTDKSGETGSPTSADRVANQSIGKEKVQ